MLDVHARWLPELLPNVNHYAFNMRCHSLAYNTDREDFPVAGGMYESLLDGEKDLHAAVAFLREEGFEKIIVCGHSSGGYYAGMYAPAEQDIVGRIFFSPLTDNKVALSWWFPREGQLEGALSHAKELWSKGKPDGLIPLDSWYWAISARSLIERAAQPDSQVWLSAVNKLKSPVLMGWSATESRDELWSNLFGKLNPEKYLLRLDGSDHWYRGQEQVVASSVSSFIERVTGIHA